MTKLHDAIVQTLALALLPELTALAAELRAIEERLEEESRRRVFGVDDVPTWALRIVGLQELPAIETPAPVHTDSPPKQIRSLPPRNLRPKGRR